MIYCLIYCNTHAFWIKLFFIWINISLFLFWPPCGLSRLTRGTHTHRHIALKDMPKKTLPRHTHEHQHACPLTTSLQTNIRHIVRDGWQLMTGSKIRKIDIPSSFACIGKPRINTCQTRRASLWHSDNISVIVVWDNISANKNREMNVGYLDSCLICHILLVFISLESDSTRYINTMEQYDIRGNPMLNTLYRVCLKQCNNL